MKKLSLIAAALCLSALLTAPAGALEYSLAAPDGPNYGKPTSIEPVLTPDGGAAKNEDLSKNAAVVPPSLFPLALSGPGSGAFHFVESSAAATSPAFTAVTADLYNPDGSLGILCIPRLGVSAKIFEGTDSAALAKGAGHFPGTSIWGGNCCFAGHNRGVNEIFGQIHTLNTGDTVTLTTGLGTRTYAVVSVEKVAETDTSGLDATVSNQITLYTCVRDQPTYRWCVKGVEIV